MARKEEQGTEATRKKIISIISTVVSNSNPETLGTLLKLAENLMDEFQKAQGAEMKSK